MEESKTVELLDYLFGQILERLAQSDFFAGEKAPSSFIVYAHEGDSTELKADAKSAIELIKWFTAIRANLFSDRSAVLGLQNTTKREGGNDAVHDIISNQVCLLPSRSKGTDIQSVDKVILCCSELLQSYYEDARVKPYIENIKRLYEEYKGQENEVITKVLRKHVSGYKKELGASFHHVLTELAFLEIRAQHNQDIHSIVPIVFNGDGIEALPFFSQVEVIWLKIKSEPNPGTDQRENRHMLFFKLLARIYENRHNLLDAFRQCYENCVKRLQPNERMPSLTEEEFKREVQKEVWRTGESVIQYRDADIRLAIGKPRSKQINVHWSVPRAVNPFFTGRTDLLERVKSALRNEGTSDFCLGSQKIFVVHGLGGMGKSEICLQLANQMRQEFWGVFWVDVSSASLAERNLIAIAKAIGSAAKNRDDALQVLANTKGTWLLILDNADDDEIDYQSYIPSGSHGTIIITSRLPACCDYNTIGSEKLTGLDTENSIQLLLKRAKIPQQPHGSSAYQIQRNESEKVVELLGSHTLALIQAGAYIAAHHCTLGDYPKVFQRQRQRVLKYTQPQMQSRYKDVYATFEASAEKLSSDALELLNILSMLHFSPLPIQLFEAAWEGYHQIRQEASEDDREETSGEASGDNRIPIFPTLDEWHVSQLPDFLDAYTDEWDSYRLMKAISALSSLSSTTSQESLGLYISMHPLVHAWAKDRQDSKSLKEDVLINVGSIIALSYHGSEIWQDSERYLRPHMQSYIDSKAQLISSHGRNPQILPILLRCGSILLDMRDDSRLARFLQNIFRELGRDQHSPSRDILPMYKTTAKNLYHLARYEESVQLFEQIVEIEKGALINEHDPELLLSQHELASSYIANNQVLEAVELLEQVVKIVGKILPETHPRRLASQYTLASAHLENNQVLEAVELLEQVVKIEGKILPETHRDRLASQHVLASAYLERGHDADITEAIKLLKHVVKTDESIISCG